MNYIPDREVQAIKAWLFSGHTDIHQPDFVMLTNELGRLSLLAKAPFKFMDITFKTILNAVLAMSTDNDQIRIDIAHFDLNKDIVRDKLKALPRKVRDIILRNSRASYLYPVRQTVADHDPFVDMLLSIIKAKFSQYPELRILLARTNGSRIVYYNRRGDQSLGCCMEEFHPSQSDSLTVKGNNIYGRVLESYRDEFTGSLRGTLNDALARCDRHSNLDKVIEAVRKPLG